MRGVPRAFWWLVRKLGEWPRPVPEDEGKALDATARTRARYEVGELWKRRYWHAIVLGGEAGATTYAGILTAGCPAGVQVSTVVAVALMLPLAMSLGAFVALVPDAVRRQRNEARVAQTEAVAAAEAARAEGERQLMETRQEADRRFAEAIARAESERDEALEQLKRVTKADLVRGIENELVAIIDDGKALTRHGLQDVKHGRLDVWCRKTRTFLEAVLGAAERQRFDQQDEASRGSFEDDRQRRLDYLGALRDRPNTWDIQTDTVGLTRAMAERRSISEADAIVMAVEGSPDPRIGSRAFEALIERLTNELRRGRDLRAHFARADYPPEATAVELQEPLSAVIDWAERVESELAEHLPQWADEFENAGYIIPRDPDPDDVSIAGAETLLAERIRVLARIVRALGEPQAESGSTEPVEVDRVQLLRQAHGTGILLLQGIPWAEGAPTSAEAAADAQRRAWRRAIEWGVETWEMLRDHFGGHSERAFFGDTSWGDYALGRLGFQMLANKSQSDGVLVYTWMNEKLKVLADLIERYDRP